MIEEIVNNEMDQIYTSILDEAKKIELDKDKYYLFVNVQLRKKLESTLKELVYLKRKIKKDSYGLEGMKRNENILLEVLKGKEQKYLSKQFNLSPAMINKAIKSAIKNITGDADELSPKDLIKKHFLELERYFILKNKLRNV